MRYDFNTKKMQGKVQINVDNWVQPTEIQVHRLSGRAYVTYITEAEAIGSDVSIINSKDIILISKVSADIATAPTSPYIVGDARYYNIPLTQVMGTFKDNTVSYDNLQMLSDKFLFEKIVPTQNSLLNITDSNTTLGKVLKVGQNTTLKEGDIILVKDNVSTPIRLNSNDYYAAEERSVVGIFNNEKDLTFKNIRFINENILMKPYISKNILNSSILETPEIDYEDLDYSDVYNRDLFKVHFADESLKDIKKGDILILNRDYTNYVYFNNEKYFIIDGKKWISGKVEERGNDDY